MNQTTLGNGFNCSEITTLAQFLEIVGNAKLNITDQIRSCPSVCSSAWGFGNPDLSGIGANISWIWQAVLAIVFVSLPALIVVLQPGQIGRLHRIYWEFFNASVLVTIPVAIATIYRIQQVAYLFEVTYLYYLTTLQFLALIGTALTGATFTLFAMDHDDDREAGIQRSRRDWIEHVAATSLACIVSFGLYLGCLKWIRIAASSAQDLPELMAACSANSGIVPAFPAALELPSLSPGQIAGMTIDQIISIIVVFGLASAAGAAFFKSVAIAFVVIVNPVTVPVAFTIGMLFCLAKMETNRDGLRNIAGSSYTDDEWGFGQVLSVFIWIPITGKLILEFTLAAVQVLRQRRQIDHGEPGSALENFRLLFATKSGRASRRMTRQTGTGSTTIASFRRESRSGPPMRRGAASKVQPSDPGVAFLSQPETPPARSRSSRATSHESQRSVSPEMRWTLRGEGDVTDGELR